MLTQKQIDALSYGRQFAYKVAGYFLDGYCPRFNLAIEIDELYHNKIKEKDLIREQNIKNRLDCNFLRIEA